MLCSPETFQDRLKWKFVASKGATWGNWRPPPEDWWPIVLGYHIQGKQTEKQQGFWATITTWTLVPFVLYYMQGTDSTLSRWLLRKHEGDKNALIRYILTCRHFFPPFDQNTLFPLTKHGCFRWLPQDDPGSVGSFFLLKGSSTSVPSLTSCTSRMVISL